MPTADPVLLDTHVLLWWKAGSTRLSETATQRLRLASEVLISPVSCWEIAMLADKGRVRLDRPTQDWVRDVLGSSGVGFAELAAATAVAAAELPGFHGDPADRFIVATAEQIAVPLLTKDRQIHEFAVDRPQLTVLW